MKDQVKVGLGVIAGVLLTTSVVVVKSVPPSPPHLEITPSNALVPPGEGQLFRAILYPADGGGGIDVTSTAKWSVGVLLTDGGVEKDERAQQIAGRLDSWPGGHFMGYEPGKVEVIAEANGVRASVPLVVDEGIPVLSFEVDGKAEPAAIGRYVDDSDFKPGGMHTVRLLATFPDGQVVNWTSHAVFDFGAYKAEDQPFKVSGIGEQQLIIRPISPGQGHIIAHWHGQWESMFIRISKSNSSPAVVSQTRSGHL